MRIIETMSREERRAAIRETETNRDHLVNIHQNSGSPAETVAELIGRVGWKAARETIAEAVNARGTWDERISSSARAWAATITTAADAETLCAHYLTTDAIHPAHVDQIARAAAEYDQEKPDGSAYDARRLRWHLLRAISRDDQTRALDACIDAHEAARCKVIREDQRRDMGRIYDAWERGWVALEASQAAQEPAKEIPAEEPAQDLNALSERVQEATTAALARAGMLAEEEPAAEPERADIAAKNINTGEIFEGTARMVYSAVRYCLRLARNEGDPEPMWRGLDEASARVVLAAYQVEAWAAEIRAEEEPAQPAQIIKPKEEYTMNRKSYVNMTTNAVTERAAEALTWHRAGDILMVSTIDQRGEPVRVSLIEGAPRKERDAERENREHCKHIALELDAYADGEIYRCPDCDEEIRLPDDVGDKYRCPHCGTVSDVDDLEQLSVWDFLADALDVDYIVSRDRKYKSCRVMVAYGGPTIYIDTDSGYVELYWWNERARYALSRNARDSVDEWAEEYWNH